MSLSPSSVAWIDEAMRHNRVDGESWLRRQIRKASGAGDVPFTSYGRVDARGDLVPTVYTEPEETHP